MSFDLHVLNGVGNTQSSTIWKYKDLENRYTPTTDDQKASSLTVSTSKPTIDMDSNSQIQTQTQCTHECRAEKWLKYLVIFAAGCVGGQVIKDIFSDEKKSEKKRKEGDQ